MTVAIFMGYFSLIFIYCMYLPSNSGTTNGQTIVIREGDNGVAYSWNSQELKWEKVCF